MSSLEGGLPTVMPLWSGACAASTPHPMWLGVVDTDRPAAAINTAFIILQVGLQRAASAMTSLMMMKMMEKMSFVVSAQMSMTWKNRVIYTAIAVEMTWRDGGELFGVRFQRLEIRPVDMSFVHAAGRGVETAGDALVSI